VRMSTYDPKRTGLLPCKLTPEHHFRRSQIPAVILHGHSRRTHSSGTPAKKIALIVAAARNVMDLNSAAGMEFVHWVETFAEAAKRNLRFDDKRKSRAMVLADGLPLYAMLENRQLRSHDSKPGRD